MPNALQQDSGLIRAKLLSGDVSYKLSAVYVEFENVASPGDPVTPPVSVPDSEGIDYYQGLSGSVSRDFMRVPISFPPLIDTDDELYELPNRWTVVVDVPAGTGYHGKPFNSGSNSTVFGLALVATPDWDDELEDLVYSRQYYEVVDQSPVPPSGVLRLTFAQTFPTE